MRQWTRTYKIGILQLMLTNLFFAVDKLPAELWVTACVFLLGKLWLKSHMDKKEDVE